MKKMILFEENDFMKKARMQKALLIAKKLKGSVIPNQITIEEIVAEQKKMHQEKIMRPKK